MKLLACSLLLATSLHAAVYDVGPGFPRTKLQQVPWATLQPGDVVNIHVTPGGYHEKIQISESGTAAAHIVVHGVPDPVTGALPIIDGKDAIEDPSIDWRNPIFSTLGIIVVSPRKTAYGTHPYGSYHVSFVDIENLDIRNALYTADGSITYTDQFGAQRGYGTFGCGIYVEWARDFAVRGCEISFCGLGVFANSKNAPAQSSARLLIERNYFHDNSNPYTVDPLDPTKVLSNGYGEHHCYTESVGVTYQYNRFGPLRPGCHGTAIKDRSSGQIFRYNEFDMFEESNVIAMLDPQGGGTTISTQPDFQDSYVYGNLVTIESYTNGISAFWWGSFDGPSVYAANHRGVLHFYDNTIVCHHANVPLFFLPNTSYSGGATVQESVDCRNNVIFADTSLQANIYTALHFTSGGATNGGGNVNLGVNWISPGWRKDSPGHAYEGQLNGTGNLIVGDSMGANNPGFVDVTTRDYHVLTGSNILDAAGALLPGDPPVLEEYSAPQSSVARVVLGAGPDLGGVESSGSPPPPPPGGAFSFSAISYSVPEAGGSAITTVNRTGGSTGAVSVVVASAPGTASSPADFSANSAVLTWPAGDTSARTFTVPIVNDANTELPETIALTLTNPTGGSALGAPAQATLTIIDDDTPPSQPIVGITASGKLIRFTSGAPGSLIGTATVSGLAAGETIRGLAFRRSTGALYAIGGYSINGGAAVGSASVYVLNPATGVATKLSDITSTLAHVSFDLGFDPVTEQLRVFGSTGQNLRIDPNTGAVLAIDTAFAYASGDAHFGATPGIVGGDYTPGLTPTAYAIDKTLDVLVRVGSAGGSPLSASSGKLTTIGALGIDTEGHTGLDFTPGGAALAVLNPATGTTTNLYTIDLTTGHATALGTIAGGEQVRDIAVATPGQIAFVGAGFEATEGDGTATISVARTGGSWGAVSVSFSTSNGSALAGSDYTAASGVLTWQDGEVGVKTFTVPIVSDALIEGDETVALALTNATGGALLIAPTSATLTIHDRLFDAWKLTAFGSAVNNPLIAGDLADPDADGVANALEYALGTNPLAANAAQPLVNVQSFGAQSFLTIAFTRAASDVAYVVEVSSDLATWDAASPIDITPAGSPPGYQLVRDAVPVASAPRRFIRLRVDVP